MVDYKDTSEKKKIVEYGSIEFSFKLQKIQQKTDADYIREEREA